MLNQLTLQNSPVKISEHHYENISTKIRKYIKHNYFSFNKMVFAIESTSTVASIMDETGMSDPLRISLAIFNFVTFLGAVVGNSLVLLGKCVHVLSLGYDIMIVLKLAKFKHQFLLF